MQVQFAASLRRMLTIALVAMVAVSSLLSPSSVAAQNQTIQSDLTGVSISYGPAYQLSEDGRYSDDVMETMMFVGSADVLAIGFLSPLIDLNASRDIMLESLFGEVGTATTIDRGDYAGVSYSLDMLNMDGFEMGAFTLFMNQRSHGYSEFYIFLAPPAYFGAAMQSAQNSFTIDGVQLMNGVDPMVMGDMVTANIGITGGTAVTDVTDVTEDNTSGDTGTTTTTDTTTTGTDTTQTGDSGEVQAYLSELESLYDEVEGALARNAQAFADVSDELITVEEGAEIINTELRYLSGTNDRLAAISVPASMQDFHNQEVVPWGDAVTAAGSTWFAALEGNATQDAAIDAINNGALTHSEFGPVLQAEIDAAASSDTGGTTTTQTDTTETTDTTTTQTDTTTTGSGDATSFVEEVTVQRLDFLASFATFNEYIGTLGEDNSDANLTLVRSETTAIAEYWVTMPSIAAQSTPPAGYEDAHAAYLDWADQVAELGNLWIAYMNGDRDAVDLFTAQIDVVNTADQTLQAEMTAAGESGSGDTTASSDTGDTTESDTGSTRTTRGSSSSETESGNSSETNTSETEGNASETTGRTSRTTASQDDDEEEDTGSTSGRTTRTSSTEEGEDEDEGSSSGRSSRTGSTETSAADNEWVGEATGLSISWSDALEVNSNLSDAQESDLDAGIDYLSLVATTPNGDSAGVTLNLFPNSGTDSTGGIQTLVNDPDLVVELYDTGAEVVGYETSEEASAVVIRAEDEIGVYYVYIQYTCLTANCDTMALLIVPADGDVLVDTLDLLETDLAVENSPISTVIPSRDVEDLVDEFGS